MPTTLTYPPDYKYTLTGLIEELENLRGKYGELPVCLFDDLHGVIPLKDVWTQDGDDDLMTDTRVVLG